MNSILNLYSGLYDREKIIFKELLNDIIFYLSEIEKNKGKISIKKQKQEIITKKSVDIMNNIFEKEGIKEDDINIKEIFENIFGSKEIEKNNILFFPVYKGIISFENNNIFSFRRDIINILDKEGIIKISDLNIIRELKLLTKGDIPKELLELGNYYYEIENELRLEYGDDIIEEDLKQLNNAERKFEFIIFKKEVIEELLDRINKIDSSDFEFRNKTLFYKGKVLYTPKQYGDRIKFLELLFSEKKGTYFKLSTIYNYIEGGGSNLTYLSESQSKKIYNIKDKINNIIFIKTGIKKTFSLGKGDNIGKICRNY